MLILSRRIGETIIAGDIKITITQLKGGAVRLGIDAPEEVRILRGELVGQVQRQQPRHHVLPPAPVFQPPVVMGFSGAA